VARIQHALAHCVGHFERLHHRAADEVIDLEPSAGHLVHARDELLRELVEDVGGAPSALHLDHDRRLGLGDHRESDRRRAGGCRGRAGKEFPARSD
jgi:hypothetical protein